MYNFINVFNNVERFRRGYIEAPEGRDEPTFLTFSIDFDFESTFNNEFFGLYDSPLFQETDPQYSAIHFLENRGFRAEAARLREFRTLLHYITVYEPWFFQSISGLGGLWKGATQMDQNYKGKEKVVEIQTLESLDLTVTYLADLYRNAVYDMIYMRELLPENLRYFSMDIYVSEFRNLKTLLENAVFTGIMKTSATTDLLSRGLELVRGASNYFEKNSSFIKFTCNFCEFDFSGSLPVQDGMNVHTPELATNKFAIKTNWYRETSNYPLHPVKTEQKLSKHKDNDGEWLNKKMVNLNDIANSVSTIISSGQYLKNTFSDLGTFNGGTGASASNSGYYGN